MYLTSCDYFVHDNEIPECMKRSGTFGKCDDCDEFKKMLDQLYGGVKTDAETQEQTTP